MLSLGPQTAGAQLHSQLPFKYQGKLPSTLGQGKRVRGLQLDHMSQLPKVYSRQAEPEGV